MKELAILLKIDMLGACKEIKDVNMNKKALIVLLLSVLLCGSKASLGAVTMTGYVASGCGRWVSDSKNPTIKVGQENALAGFLSGIAFATDQDALKGVDFASYHLWVTNYCTANPLESAFHAAQALFIELKKRKGI